MRKATLIATLLLGAGLHGQQVRSQTARPQQSAPSRVQLSATAPLVATAKALYSVASDGMTLVRRNPDLATPWEPVSLEQSLPEITGIASDGADLIVASRKPNSVYRVDPGTGLVKLLHEGKPLEQPGDVAVLRDRIYVADDDRLVVLQPDAPPVPLLLGSRGKLEGPVFLSGGCNSLIISSGDGRVLEYRDAPHGRPYVMTLLGESAEPSGQQTAAQWKDDTIQPRGFPSLRNPGRVACLHGVVYLTDKDAEKVESRRPSQHTGLYAMGRIDRRAVRLVRNGPAGRKHQPVSSLAVTDAALFVMRGGEVERWPRLVPAEITLPQSNWSEVMTAVYDYLLDKRILPLREVALDKDIENTLKAEEILPAGYTKRLTPVLCGVNAGICDGSRGFRPMQPNQKFWAPDVNSERLVDTIRDEIPKGMTLGGWVDSLVISEEFGRYRSEEKLREYNEKAAMETGPGGLRQRSTGVFVVPVENRRYVAAVDAADVPPAPSPLTRLQATYRGVKVVSMDEQPSAAAGGRSANWQEDWAALRDAFDRMLTKIDYILPEKLPTVRIGVVEEMVDMDHPDFSGAQGTGAWVIEDQLRAEPAGSGAEVPRPHVRAYQKTDHGTMVAGLIGARQMAFEKRGLLPDSMLYWVPSHAGHVNEGIRVAFNNQVRIFNFSVHYRVGITPPLEERIENNGTALFVVAAGNDVIPGMPDREKPLCRGFSAYPPCWHDRPNVLVVTATDETGKGLLQPRMDVTPVEGGANWSRKAVHIAAPGTGFHAPGIAGAYVPTRGTSFAAPLVSAVAGMLNAQRLEARDIKERIIATADYEPGLEGKVFAGRLNVRRAVSDLDRGALVRLPQNGDPGEKVTIKAPSGTIVIRARNSPVDTHVPLSHLLRLTRWGSTPTFRLVYRDPQTGDVQIFESVTFATREASKFSATKVDENHRLPFHLMEWDDYVAPVLPR